MRRLAVSLVILLAAVTCAASQTIDNLGAAGALTGTENVPIFQTANPAVKTTTQAIANLAPSGTVTSVATGCQATGGTITTTGTISTQTTITDVTGANPAITTGYCGGLETLDNASPQVPTIAVAGGAGFPQGWYTDLCNIAAGSQTITPATGTIGGASTYVLAAGSKAAPKCVRIVSDAANTNYVLEFPPAAAGVSALTCAGVSAGTGALTCAVDVQFFGPNTSGTWTAVAGIKWVHVWGCGAGGGGGSGPLVVSGTTATGGAGGGGANCHWKVFKASDLGASQLYATAAAPAGGIAISQAGASNGNPGTTGSNTTFGSTLETFWGGGGGGAGQDSSTVSTGGAGGGPYSAGGQASATDTCSWGNATGNRGSVGVLASANMGAGNCGTGGGGGATSGQTGLGAGYSTEGAPGGAAGAGMNATPANANGGPGGQSLGCVVAATGGGVNTVGTSTAADFPYHPGCGGGGGGNNHSANSGTAGTGGAGTQCGAGGGGGGSALSAGSPVNTSGAGGVGGGGCLLIVSY